MQKPIPSQNDFGIDDRFYKKRLAKKIGKLKGFQKNLSYEVSQEYGDLQLVLNQFAKSNTNVIFVIPPVNSKWMVLYGTKSRNVWCYGF